MVKWNLALRGVLPDGALILRGLTVDADNMRDAIVEARQTATTEWGWLYIMTTVAQQAPPLAQEGTVDGEASTIRP